MSLPGLAVLYASIVPKKWATNVLAMMFAGFSLVLVVWVLWGYKMGFGATSIGGGVRNGVQTQLSGVGGIRHFFDNFVGKPGQILNAPSEQGQAVSAANTAVPFHFPTDTLAYFQFVFAAITPLLFLGSVLGRIKFLAWCLLVPLWSTFVYSIDAFLLWGGGYFAQEGALDFSGGFVIHMSAGVSGFVAAWVLGPRLLKDRRHFSHNNMVMAAVGAGILWLGWNGFNGGDPYYAGADMAAAVVNTNLATAAGVLTWMAMDGWFSKAKKPTFLGGVNGMICGLVGITPCAGWVNGWGALAVGTICTAVVWVAWNYLSKVRPFSKVDDALGVVYTHGMAGLLGGLLLGVFADPNMLEYRLLRGQVRRDVGHVHAVLRRGAHVHRFFPSAVGTVPSGGLRDLLVRAHHVPLDEAHRTGAARRAALLRRGARDRGPRHPRRRGVPRGRAARARAGHRRSAPWRGGARRGRGDVRVDAVSDVDPADGRRAQAPCRATRAAAAIAASGSPR